KLGGGGGALFPSGAEACAPPRRVRWGRRGGHRTTAVVYKSSFHRDKALWYKRPSLARCAPMHAAIALAGPSLRAGAQKAENLSISRAVRVAFRTQDAYT